MGEWVVMATGLLVLLAGGELLVRGASGLAAAFGVSPLVIGLTVVAFGTSAPELAVSLQAVRAGSASLAVGNIIGSNIFNVLFILGASALLAPLVVSRRVVQVEVPVMIVFTMLAVTFLVDGRVAGWEGLTLCALVIVYLVWLVRAGGAEQFEEEGGQIEPTRRRTWRLAVLALAGLGLLVSGARWLVTGATGVAQSLGVSDVVIGLTIVAVGTSLPEVAASLVATARGHRDIAIGNVIGSNIFNLAVILAPTAVLSGGLDVPPGVAGFDAIVMLAVALACLPIFFTGYCIARWEGALFLAYYGAYTVYLVLDATEHELLPHFADAMIFFAVPLTAVTLGVLVAGAAWRRNRARG